MKVKVQDGIASWSCLGCGLGQHEFAKGSEAEIENPYCGSCIEPVTGKEIINGSLGAMVVPFRKYVSTGKGVKECKD